MKLIDADELISRMAMCETIKECIQAVKESPTANKWISVSEKLPKENSYVLVCCEDGFIGTDDYFSYGFDDYKDEVIAWQPLPEPCEVWNGVHGSCLQPKGTFEKLFNDPEEEEDGI